MKHKLPKKNGAQPCKRINYCKFCDKKIYGNTYKFNSHLFKHKAVKPRFECQQCDVGFYRYDTFLTHKNKHDLNRQPHKKLYCHYCNQGYVNKRRLIIHLSIHESSMPKSAIIKFTCEVCGVTFTEKRTLQHHIRKAHFNHTDTEPTHAKRLVNDSWIEGVISTNVYVKMTKVNNNIISIRKCGTVKRDTDIAEGYAVGSDYCFKRDLTESQTATKSNTYNPFNYTNYSKAICNYCDKEMLKKSIEKHIREKHLEVRKFKCSVCNNGFKRRYQLTQHICGNDQGRGRRMYIKNKTV